MTNVATVLKNHLELAAQVDEIIAVAGRRPGQTFVLGKGGQPLMDMNFEYDSEGMHVLLDSGAPIVLAPFEISSRTPVPEKDIERFATEPELADFFLEPLHDYVDWYDEHFEIRSIFPFDTLAVAYLTSPEWIRCADLPIEIQTLPDDIKAGRRKTLLDRVQRTEFTEACEVLPQGVRRVRTGFDAPSAESIREKNPSRLRDFAPLR